jgi:hypothetical protein
MRAEQTREHPWRTACDKGVVTQAGTQDDQPCCVPCGSACNRFTTDGMHGIACDEMTGRGPSPKGVRLLLSLMELLKSHRSMFKLPSFEFTRVSTLIDQTAKPYSHQA